MAAGGSDLPDDTFDFGRNDGRDYDNDTTPLLNPDRTQRCISTPAPKGEQFKMQTWQKENSGLPKTAYAEISFGVRITDDDISRRLDSLRRDSVTGLLDTREKKSCRKPLEH